jgi:hypothetical protein
VQVIINLLPMAEPAPPASPTALTIAEWPATSWVVAKRPKETTVVLEKYILSRSDEIVKSEE